MDIHNYQYNMHTKEIELIDTYRVNQTFDLAHKEPTSFYISSDDPAVSARIVVLNKVKQVGISEHLSVFSTDSTKAGEAFSNFLKKKARALRQQADIYEQRAFKIDEMIEDVSSRRSLNDFEQETGR